MSRDDRIRWDEKHADALAKGGPTHAPAFLDAITDLLPAAGPGGPRRALDVACGRGAATVRLAEAGYDVVALDVSLVALAAVRRLADARGVSRSVHTIVSDLDDGLPFDVDADGDGAPDAACDALAFDPFDLVLCVHFHAPALWPALRAALAPGGVLAIETLTTENLALGLPSPGERWLVRPGEILAAAEGLEVLRHTEEVADGAHRARLVARRLRGSTQSRS